MAHDVYKPFDADVVKHGGYQYTDLTRKSCAHVNRRFSDIIMGNVQFDNMRVVDVGCGDGTFTAVLRAETRAKFILGIDPAEKAVIHANQTYAAKYRGLEFRVGLASSLVEAGERFDVAVYRGVIHHVSEPEREIATALKLARVAFFLEPNGWNPVVNMLEMVSSYHREHEERSYRMAQYRRWIAGAGGSVDRAFYFGLVPIFCPAWLVSIASALEPVVEKIPLVRVLCCGQIGILVSRS